MTRTMSDDDLYAVLRAADPLAGRPPRSSTATEESLHRLLARGPSSVDPEPRGRTSRSATRRRRPGGRPRILAGAGLGIGTVAAAVVLAFAGASSPPAFAVTTAADGTVTITLNSLDAVDALNAKLAAAGVHVRVAEVEPGCNAPVQLAGSNAPPATLTAAPGGGANTIQLSPAPNPGASGQGLSNTADGHTLVLAAPRTNVPDGQTLVLAASPSGLQPVGQIDQTTPPSCVAPN